MKKISILFICLLLTHLTQGQSLLIKNVNLISMRSKQVDKAQSVLIEDGIIKEIASFDKISYKKGINVIDANGQFLLPGLADMHVHLPEEDEVDHLLKMSVAAGITHIRVMNNAYSQLDLKEDIINNKYLVAPKLFYSHLIKRSLKEASMVQMDSILTKANNSGIDFIKLYSIANEEVYDKLMVSAKKNNLKVCGHYPRYVKEKKWKFMDINKVLKSGLRSIEHVGGYTSIRDDKQLLEAIKLTKKQGVYNCPTLDWAVMAFDIQYPDAVKSRLTYRSLPKKITGHWEQDYATYIEEAGGEEKILATRTKRIPVFEKKKKVLKLLYENDCLLLVGSDGERPYQAPGFNLWEEMKNWSELGIDNYTILKSATVNAAHFFKQEATWGTIEVGKQANLIILNKNPLENIEHIATIQSTIVSGKLFHKKEILEKL